MDAAATRQQALVARAQALATLASIDALLATLPEPARPVEAKRTAFLGMDEENPGDSE